ncbi:MAG: Fic family protein [Candidatus Aenigmarchaeota archaeon]|nr:Fic family protein [Candidatus Aenigmarchaeota archaeon]
MTSLTTFDVLAYLSNGKMPVDHLTMLIRRNAHFPRVSDRRIRALLRELQERGVVAQEAETLALTSAAANTLAFLLWAKKDGLDYNIPLQGRNLRLFQQIFEEGPLHIVSHSPFSRPTTIKMTKALEQLRFISVQKRKPLVAKANVTDTTLFLANAFGFAFARFQGNLQFGMRIQDSPKLREHLIRLHVYSTTVTEGNTATESDVERVLGNRSSRLSPKEVLEIVNAKRAVEELYRVYKTESLTADLMKRLHATLMANLVEHPGEFAYARKRIIGSAAKLPDSKIEIDTAIQAVLNFYAKYEASIHPSVLAALVHFLLVSIHPFIDGNGRVARLVHSYILMRAGFPLFAFDPNHRNRYFDLLEVGRTGSVDAFVQFCIDKHRELLDTL